MARHQQHAYTILKEDLTQAYEQLQRDASPLSLAGDMWSTNSHISVLGVMAYGIGVDWRLYEMTLGVEEFSGEHTGEVRHGLFTNRFNSR